MINKKIKIFIYTAVFVFLVGVIGIYLLIYGNPFVPKLKNVIKITDCSSVSPSILTVKLGDEINFMNIGKNGHNLDIASSVFALKAGETKKITANFTMGAGSYGYGCDSTLVAGQVRVTPANTEGNITPKSFKELYDTVSDSIESCLKTALGSDFDKSYSDSSHIPSMSAITKVNVCLVPPTPVVPSTTKN